MSVIGGIVCTTAEAIVIHFIQIFYPKTIGEIKDRFIDLIPVRVSGHPTGLLLLVIFSMIIWFTGFYLILKSES